MWRQYLQKRRARREALKAARVKRHPVREYFELIVETMVFVFFVMTFLLQSFVIPTGSMEDTLMIGDHLVVDKVAYARSSYGWDGWFLPLRKLERGMVVTFKSPQEMDKEYVKRLVALPGDTVRLSRRKLFINGVLQEEPYTFFRDDQYQPQRDDFPMNQPPHLVYEAPFYFRFRSCLEQTPQGWVFRVPPGHYFCLGDNRDRSSDCRFWGPVPEENIIGRPWRVYWSYASTSRDYLTPGLTHKVKDLFMTVVHFFSRTRWERTGKGIV